MQLNLLLPYTQDHKRFIEIFSPGTLLFLGSFQDAAQDLWTCRGRGDLTVVP